MSKPVLPPFDEESRRVVQGVDGRRTPTAGVLKKTHIRKDGSRKQGQEFINTETVNGCILAPGDKTPLVRGQCCVRGCWWMLCNGRDTNDRQHHHVGRTA